MSTRIVKYKSRVVKSNPDYLLQNLKTCLRRRRNYLEQKASRSKLSENKDD